MISVTPGPGDRLSVAIRDHVVEVDQHVEDGGEDAAPTPLEMLLVSLASCVAHYARRYLRRHDLPTEGLQVQARWEMAKNPARVGSVDIDLTIPDGVPDDRREALLAVASHCTVHNTLVQPPEVRIVAV